MTNNSLNLKASYMYANIYKSPCGKQHVLYMCNKHTKLAVMQLKVACTHICKSEQAVFFNILTGKQIKECWQSCQYSKITKQMFSLLKPICSLLLRLQPILFLKIFKVHLFFTVITPGSKFIHLKSQFMLICSKSHDLF